MERPFMMLGQAEMQKYDGQWLLAAFTLDDEHFTSIRDAYYGPDDVLITSYPKSGTMWLCRILSLILTDADVTKAEARTLRETVLLIDQHQVARCIEQSQPRCLRTHLIYRNIPRSFREGQGKIIYIMRNPKDVSVSLYHFTRLNKICQNDMQLDEFFSLFIDGDVPYGSWFEHVTAFWEYRNNDNVFILRYEDLMKDLRQGIARIAAFVGRRFSPQQTDAMVAACSFEAMRQSRSVYAHWLQQHNDDDAKFLRKGIIGDWKAVYTESMNDAVDARVEREITPLGIDIVYE